MMATTKMVKNNCEAGNHNTAFTLKWVMVLVQNIQPVVTIAANDILQYNFLLEISNGQCLAKLALVLIPTLSNSARLKFPQGNCILL